MKLGLDGCDRSVWRPFFPLFPRRIAKNDWRWLEWIERRGWLFIVGGGESISVWDYRERQP